MNNKMPTNGYNLVSDTIV